MKTFLLLSLLLFTTGCTLHHKSTLSPNEITQKVDKLMDDVYTFALKSENYALTHGRKLTDDEIVYAKSLGLKEPNKVRVLLTSDFPFPKNKEVLKGFQELGYDSSLVAGVTYGHGIFIKNAGFVSWISDIDAILAHELVHVKQVEQARNFREYLRKYLIEAFSYEYFDMPYEHEAYEKTANFKSFN